MRWRSARWLGRWHRAWATRRLCPLCRELSGGKRFAAAGGIVTAFCPPSAVRETSTRSPKPTRAGASSGVRPRSHTSRRNIFEDQFAQALARANRVIRQISGKKSPQPSAYRRVVETVNRLRGLPMIDKAVDIFIWAFRADLTLSGVINGGFNRRKNR